MSETRKMMRDAPEMLYNLFDAATRAAQQAGLNDEQADQLAIQIIDELEEHWAGLQLYFAKGTRMRLRQRDLDIYREFSGHNHAELAAKYKVSIVWVYAIVKRVKDAIHDDAQQPLL
ncbi:Mor transcription activator family protein [Gynuella sp.]|uniref:Mor transcription activator family protein n=1 Tax=Gynuella sp. TaxID=2969146 RepID=UPI003D107719